MQHPLLPSAKIPARNRLLDGLAAACLKRLSTHIELVSLTYGQVLYESGKQIQYVYFPYDSLVCLLGVVGDGKSVEVAVVGNEGVVGGSAAIDIDISSLRAVVLIGGMAARLSFAKVQEEFVGHGAWNPELLRFNYALMNQAAQAAACNRFHNTEARLARWLLTTSDRTVSTRVYVTHDFLSRVLGVRRVGVSAAAASLQERGLITYSRGHVRLINPEGLEASACDCYGMLKKMRHTTTQPAPGSTG